VFDAEKLTGIILCTPFLAISQTEVSISYCTINRICASSSGHLQTVVVDKTARKVAQLAQLVQGPPPSFDELEAYLFRHPDVKLPVSDAKYYSLVAANEALMSQIEPASASGAEALAEVVTAALRMQYEPVEDEISLAGVQTIALSCRA